MAKYEKKNTLKEDRDIFQNLFITFIGAGNMAQAICRRLLSIKGENGDVLINANHVSAISSAQGTNLATFKKFGCQTYLNDYDEAIENIFLQISMKCADSIKKRRAHIIFLCVKPHVYYQIRNGLSCAIDEHKPPFEYIVISTMAGVPLADIPHPGKHEKVTSSCRIMTNLACSIGEASIGLYDVPSSDNSLLYKELLTYLGQLFICPSEQQLDAICGLCGSGLAYVFSMIQAMADGAVLAGLPRSLALDMAAQTTLGAAALCQQKNDETGFNESNHPILWRDKVTSPGGTTITGLLQLEESSFNSSIMKAIKVATEKSILFSKSFDSNRNK